MIQKARGRFIFNRKTLMDYGAKVSLFPGVDTWFKGSVRKLGCNFIKWIPVGGINLVHT